MDDSPRDRKADRKLHKPVCTMHTREPSQMRQKGNVHLARGGMLSIPEKSGTDALSHVAIHPI